jgi:hypothetical protein
VRVRDPSYHELTLLLKPEAIIIRLISFLREFLTRLTKIKSHAGSMFYTLFSLSIRVLPSYYPGLSVCIVSWTRAFEAIVNESCIYHPSRVVWIFHQVAPSLVLKIVGIMC